MKVFQLNLKRSVTLSTFPGENIFARTHSVWPHAVTWDEVFDLRCLPIFLLLYVPLCTGYSDVTSVADLRSPRVPSRWPNASPEEAQHRRDRASSRWTKGECNVLAPHESSQAHREHIRTSGFYLPFLFFYSPAKIRLGVKSVRCHMTATHTVQKSFMYAFSQFTLSGSISPVRHWSVMVKGDFWQEPAGISRVLKEAFTRECSLTSTRAAEAEKTALHAIAENSSAAENERRPQHGRIWRYEAVSGQWKCAERRSLVSILSIMIMLHEDTLCKTPEKVSDEVKLPKKSRISKKLVQVCSRERLNIFIKALLHILENLNNLLMLWNVTALNLNKKNSNNILCHSIGDVLWN